MNPIAPRYRLCVRDHIMIAHSFRGEVFGPAQRLHGATYVVDLVFSRPALDADGLVVDIGLASRVLREVLEPLDYRNLDEIEAFQGANTTTEFLAREIFERDAAHWRAGRLGQGADGLDALSVTLNESHRAWAAFEGPLVRSPDPA